MKPSRMCFRLGYNRRRDVEGRKAMLPLSLPFRKSRETMEEKPAEQQSHPEYGMWHEQADADEKARQDDFQLRQEYRSTIMIYAQTEREHQEQVHALFLALLNHSIPDRVQTLKDYHQAVREYRVFVREYQVLVEGYRVSVQHYQQRVRDYWQTGQDQPTRFYRPRHA